MTYEEAANILDPVKRESALLKYDSFERLEKLKKACQVAAEMLRKCDQNAAEMQPSCNKPLTLEQLREMDGQPVWSRKHKEWFLICNRPSRCMMYDRNGFCLPARDFVDYGLYAYPPAHIDRAAWEPCGECAPNCPWCKHFQETTKTIPKICRDYNHYSNYEPEYKYCCECGRPLTTEVWAELEKRLRW